MKKVIALFCMNCGAAINDDGRYCMRCGHEVIRVAQIAKPVDEIPTETLYTDGTGMLNLANPEQTDSTPQASENYKWIQGFTGKSKVKVYFDTNTNSGIVAELPIKSPLYLGQEVKTATGRWFAVRLPEGQPGYIQQGVPVISQKGMVSNITSWAYGMIFIGFLSIILSSFLNPLWGALLIVIGIIALLVKKRAMFIVFGLVLVLVGFMNMLVGGQWMIFGGLQVIWGISEFYKYSLYGILRQI